MQESTLAKRYAIALADLAQENNILDQVGEELIAFQALLSELPPMRTLMVSPTSEEDKQQTALAAYLEKARPADITGNFLRLLISKRRMSLIDGIVAAFNRERNSRSNRTTVKVRTPMALTQSHTSQLQSSLSEMTGKEVELDVVTEPDLLGGIVVQIGSVMLDYSIRSRLNRMKSYMKG